MTEPNEAPKTGAEWLLRELKRFGFAAAVVSGVWIVKLGCDTSNYEIVGFGLMGFFTGLDLLIRDLREEQTNEM